jgi:hypothetical protein
MSASFSAYLQFFAQRSVVNMFTGVSRHCQLSGLGGADSVNLCRVSEHVSTGCFLSMLVVAACSQIYSCSAANE